MAAVLERSGCGSGYLGRTGVGEVVADDLIPEGIAGSAKVQAIDYEELPIRLASRVQERGEDVDHRDVRIALGDLGYQVVGPLLFRQQ